MFVGTIPREGINVKWRGVVLGAGLPSTVPCMGMRGYTMNKDDYLKRLRRIEGQVRGLQRLIEDDTYCIDVLTQISAATSALRSVAVGVLDEHVRHCVANAAEGNTDEMISEAIRAIERLVRS
jgi:CsoR family transcriptional regulator, copper-sensing transcriptional repressor